MLHRIIVAAVFASAAEAQTSLPAHVCAMRGIEYVKNAQTHQRLDLFLPQKSVAPLPVVIWIHGGGWNKGGLTNCPPVALGYLQGGYAVANVDYRLSQDARFPAQIEDCKAAIRWLRAHAREYGLDPNRFGVWGRSAGGHLVALLGTSGGVKAFERGENLDMSSRVQAVCDFAGPTDFLSDVQPGSHLYELESQLLGAPVDGATVREQARLASPVAHVSSQTPPFLIVQGTKDDAVPLRQSERLFAALQQAGVPAHFHTIIDGPHGILGAGNGTLYSGPVIPALVRAFFDYRLLGQPTDARHWEKTSSSPLLPDPPTAK